MLLKGLETLPLRVARAVRGGRRKVARSLDGQQGVRPSVLYSGLLRPPHRLRSPAADDGQRRRVVTFELAGGKEAAFHFLNALRLIDIPTT